MERAELERSVTREPEPAAPPVPARLPAAAQVLALQRTAGNHAVAQMLSAAPQAAIQRQLDDDFPHKGKPTAEEARIAKRFANLVSDLVDEVHLDLLAGNVTSWKGAKIATFLDLVERNSPMAVTHAGNAIEERVYARMKETAFPCEWTPQFAEGMGSASKPDIVAHVSEDHDALIDVTSDRLHVLSKAGGWTTSKRYVYVAEAWFPSVVAQHIPRIREALAKGGLDAEQVKKMQAEVAEERRIKAEARKQQFDEARQRYAKYGSVSAFAAAEFGGNKTEAQNWMRENGLGGMKGVRKLKGPRKMSAEAKAKKRQQVRKLAYKRKKVEAKDKAAEKAEATHDVRAEEFMKRRKGTTTVVEEPEHESQEDEVLEGTLEDEEMSGRDEELLDDDDEEQAEDQDLDDDEEMAGTL